MWNNIAIYSMIVSVVSYLYYANERNKEVINTLRQELVVQKYDLTEKIKSVKFNTSVKIQKQNIIKKVKYDKHKTYDINTTRFYLK